MFVQLPHKSHDRFLIVDDDVYPMGASVKDMGTSLCAITKMEMSPDVVLSLVFNPSVLLFSLPYYF